jgi:hypothetical protein
MWRRCVVRPEPTIRLLQSFGRVSNSRPPPSSEDSCRVHVGVLRVIEKMVGNSIVDYISRHDGCKGRTRNVMQPQITVTAHTGVHWLDI